jgi:hypothetical protein
MPPNTAENRAQPVAISEQRTTLSNDDRDSGSLSLVNAVQFCARLIASTLENRRIATVPWRNVEAMRCERPDRSMSDRLAQICAIGSPHSSRGVT